MQRHDVLAKLLDFGDIVVVEQGSLGRGCGNVHSDHLVMIQNMV